MNPAHSSGIGNRKLPHACSSWLSDKFKFNKDIMLETGQVGNVNCFVRPIGDVDSSPLTFRLDPMADTFLQTDNMYFWVKCKIIKGNNNVVTAADNFGIVSAFGLSFFRNIKVLLNGFELNPSCENDIGYKNYIETVMSYDLNEQNTYLASSILDLDDMDDLECVNGRDVAAAGENQPAQPAPPSMARRYQKVKNSTTFDFTVPVCCDFFRSDTHIAPKNKITIVATRESDSFLIKSAQGNEEQYKVKIEDIKIYFNRIRLDPSLTTKILGKPCQYLSAQTQLKKYALPDNITSYNIEIYNGILPRTVVIAQVQTTAVHGSYTQNPFNFQHFDISRLTLRLNGQSCPPDSFTPDFTNNLYSREYTEFLLNCGFYQSDRSCSISYERYKKGSTFFVFDTTFDKCNSLHVHKSSQGNLELEINWRNPLPTPVSILVYSVFNQRVIQENLTLPATVELL